MAMYFGAAAVEAGARQGVRYRNPNLQFIMIKLELKKKKMRFL